MRFYWCYDPDYAKGLEKHGLIDANTGVKLVHAGRMAHTDVTNRMLEPDSEFGRYVLKRRAGLLIDRGCGGTHYYPFTFCRAHLDHYARELGDRFLGVQMHEWCGNTINDWLRLKAQREKGGGDRPAYLKPLEYGSAGDYEGREFPATAKALVEEANRLYRLRAADLGQHVNLVDSGCDSYWQAYANGARNAMAEVGAQTSLTRLQVACVRGAARAHGRPWGIYYEPWGGLPFSVTWFNPEVSLWALGEESRKLEYFKHGGNGGGSRAIQFRVLMHGALAGAQSAAEEWGAENTFYDWRNFELTEYGRVFADVFAFTRRYEMGEAFTPVAIMLDEDYGPLSHSYLGASEARHKRPDKYLRFYDPTALDAHVREVIRSVFVPHEEDQHTAETCCLTSSPLPDAFDVVYADINGAGLARYGCVLYAGADMEKAKARFPGYGGQWVDANKPGAIARVEGCLRAWLPFWVEGNVAWTVNLTREGWMVGLFNNHGVTRSTATGDVFDEGKGQEVVIRFKDGPAACELLRVGRRGFKDGDMGVAGPGQVKVHVPAGDVRVVVFKWGAGG
jgi:hypothetical protein